jgi:hypothetical protein
MNDSQPTIVVRRRNGRRPWVVAGVALVMVLAILFAAFEAGRMSAGYFSTHALRTRLALGNSLEQVTKENERLQAQVAQYEMTRRVDRESYAQVEKSLADLQTQINRQTQDLAFYRGIVSPADGLTGLRIQRAQLMPGSVPLQYRMLIVLIQAARHGSGAAGTVEVTVDGIQAGKPASLPLEALTTPARHVLGFSFRYYQELEVDLQLPADFQPSRVNLEAQLSGSAAPPIRQAFTWLVESP